MSNYHDQIEIGQGHYLRVSKFKSCQGAGFEIEAIGEPAKIIAHQVSVQANAKLAAPPSTTPIDVTPPLNSPRSVALPVTLCVIGSITITIAVMVIIASLAS